MIGSMMPQSPEQARYVFVYGTLRRGGRNDIRRYAPTSRFVGEAEIPGTMYAFDGYPGVSLLGSARVVGEIYAIDGSVEARLDVLEEVRSDGSGEYIKRGVDVAIGADVYACLVYEIHPDRLRGAPVIPTGDWFNACLRVS
jgi:gamma-glutamylcyclotransferase (GGCT)/AIG2-like uncharacterized protein YtfP